MSMSVLGANGLEGHRTVSSFGTLRITATPKAEDPDILMVDIGAENRIDAVSMETRKGETVDQFCGRIRSMLSGLLNAEPRKKVEAKAAAKVDAKADANKNKKVALQREATT